jgi:DNA mismatch repair protein MutS
MALDALESQQRASDDQIDLFADATSPLVFPPVEEGMEAPNGAALASPAESATLALLHRIDPDALTPREALDALYQLKSVISS